ncbi:SMP-30/gluconolactonase/LRE family protein [Amycolatopsis australiensis]|uniref:Sugar lactone lactonase YvrE n=1 Tax=Amycolatopsis australiensis TaxID=546364 RepID=A0A1K1SQU3_9PSEU|nr:SMP-30/gluconolactonase/LRE family protein [Amycolatopsis australiensis]SFW86691.1 Sugar lactone lactonase YvrE [Amycolatopsis australiensis]
MEYRLETLSDDFVFLEGPRWHDGQLWLSDQWGHAVHALAESGERTKVADFPQRPSGISVLPDGTVVVVSMADRRLLSVTADGVVAEYADLSETVPHDLNDTVADRAGNIYVGTVGYDIVNGADFKPAELFLVRPGGRFEVVADGLEFPNGAVITPDGGTLIVAETFGNRLTAFTRAADGTLSGRRVWAALGERTPDGICLDASGAVWVSSFMTDEFVRVGEGGEVLDVIPVPGRRAVACALGGADGRTFFGLTYAGAHEDIVSGRKLARVEVCRVAVRAGGSP